MDNISKNLNIEHEKGHLHEKMINNISEPLDIILEQNYAADATNNSELPEVDHNLPETLKDLSLEKENLHEKIITIFHNLWELFFNKTLWSQE